MPAVAPQLQHSVKTYDCFEVSPVMKATLKEYILKQRQKKKEEEEQDAVLHRERKIREIKRQQDTESLEQTKEQINQLEKKLDSFKKEKHDLFSQLKKVLNQEEEQRRRVQQLQLQHDREKSEVLAKVASGLPANLLLAGMSSPNSFLPKPLAIAGSPPSQSTILSPVLKRPRSPSPQTPQSSQSSGGFLSPKRATPPYQRSPYHSLGGAVFSPRGVLPSSVDAGGRFLPAGLQQSIVATAPPPLFPRLALDANPRSPQYDVRPVAPQATHLPARIPQHQHMSSIPILPQQKQMGSITSGFPVNKTSFTGNMLPICLPPNRLPSRNLPQQTFGQQPHQRL